MLQFNRTSNVQFKGVNLVNDESAKYLGIHIDTKLSFLSHIKHVVKKTFEAIVRHISTETLRTQGDFIEVLPNIYRTNHHIGFVGLWFYIKTPIEHHLHDSKKLLRLFHLRPQFHPSRELFFQNGFLNVFELYAMEFLNMCLKSVCGDNCSYFFTASIRHALRFMKRGV